MADAVIEAGEHRQMRQGHQRRERRHDDLERMLGLFARRLLKVHFRVWVCISAEFVICV